MAAVRLGRNKRNSGNEFWGVNAIKTYPPRAVRTQVGFKSSVGLGTNKSAQFKLNNKNQYILYIYIINYFKGPWIRISSATLGYQWLEQI